jgi:hypothetical protein
LAATRDREAADVSYDLYLFQPEPGVDPRVTAERQFLADEDFDEDSAEEDEELGYVSWLNPGEPNPEYEQRKQKMAMLLTEFDSDLTIFPFNFEELASQHNISEEEARKRFRHVALEGPEDLGIQISLEDVTGDITVPYWHSGAQANRALKKIWGYIDVLQRVGGYRVYDPQLDEVLDLERDFANVVAKYEAGVQYVRQLANEDEDES